MYQLTPPHIAKARVRFVALCQEKTFMIPVGDQALRLATEEYYKTPLVNKGLEATRQAHEAQQELEHVSEELVSARRTIRELEEVVQTMKASRRAAKQDRAASRKQLRRLLDLTGGEMVAEAKVGLLRSTLYLLLEGRATE